MGFLAVGLAAVLGDIWASRTGINLQWKSVCYGDGLFVAVSQTGSGNRVMTSPDGITWTTRTSAADYSWTGVCYGNGLFVAVSQTGSGNRVMTSPDGITWTIRNTAADNSWASICYGNGLFVAVSGNGIGNNVMTSPDGITWTIRTSAADNSWESVCYGNGLFVAVARSGSGNRVMTSPDGITWTIRTSAANNNWQGVCYGNGLFVAVASTGTGNRVMTSPDGITWTIRTSAADNNWQGVCYGNGLFVAVANASAGNPNNTSALPRDNIMTSPDGINWTKREYTNNGGVLYLSVCYCANIFVTIGGSSVMTSGAIENTAPQPNAFSRKIDVDETANRALDTTYTNNSDSTLLVRVSYRCAITLAGGNAYCRALMDTATPPTVAASGSVGILAGLLNEDNSFQICFLVNPGGTYFLDSVTTNGTVTVAKWFEMRF